MSQAIKPVDGNAPTNTTDNLPSTSDIVNPLNLDLTKLKSDINQALSEYQIEQIGKLLQRVSQLTTLKEVIEELSFTEWLLEEKSYQSCGCCNCSCQACIAMDKGDEMVYFYLKDCSHAYVKSEARLAWEWVCYSIALPCLCVFVIPVLAYAGGCYCRGCVPNLIVCNCIESEEAQAERKNRQKNEEALKKIRKFKKLCQSYS